MSERIAPYGQRPILLRTAANYPATDRGPACHELRPTTLLVLRAVSLMKKEQSNNFSFDFPHLFVTAAWAADCVTAAMATAWVPHLLRGRSLANLSGFSSGSLAIHSSSRGGLFNERIPRDDNLILLTRIRTCIRHSTAQPQLQKRRGVANYTFIPLVLVTVLGIRQCSRSVTVWRQD